MSLLFRAFALLAALLAGPLLTPVFAQSAQRAAPLPAYWHLDDVPAQATTVHSTVAAKLRAYRAFRLDVAALRVATDNAPTEEMVAADRTALGTAPVITVPLPDGGTARFRLYQTQTMAPALAAQVPQIRTFAGIGADNPTLSIRCDVSPLGFRALGQTAAGTFQIDPVSMRDPAHYLCYARRDLLPDPAAAPCITPDGLVPPPAALRANAAVRTISLVTTGFYQHTFQVAYASTGQFTARCGGQLPTLFFMASLVNQVNAIYQRDAATRFQLAANSLSIIYTDSLTDGYYDPVDSLMQNYLINQNQINLDQTLGNANYDVGQVFNHGGGGLATRTGALSSFTKAKATLGNSNPLDPYFLKTVIHEMGHQFGSPHTFNGTAQPCGGQRTPDTAWEPGAGTTVMSYSGNCGVDNLQSAFAELYFHSGSVEIIGTNIYLLKVGPNGVNSPVSGNTPPVLSSQPANRTIPVDTPFRLTAAATDADGDFLSYCWDEMDLGPAGTFVKPGDQQTAGSTVPLFRSWSPVAEPTRYFPQLGPAAAGEALPTVARDLNFRCTVRDGSGGLAQTSNVVLTVNPAAGPFRVTSPLSANGFWWTSGAPANVSWDVARTDAAPISCATVNIRLTTDDGASFTTLATQVPNNGSCPETVPAGLKTANARVVVEAVGHVFYAVSPAFPIEPPAPTFLGIEPAAAMPGETVVLTLAQPGVGNPAAFVTFGKLGTETLLLTSLSATELQFTVPLTALSPGNLVLNLSNTRNQASTYFQVLPLVRALAPAAGAPGDSVSISIFRPNRFDRPARDAVDVRFNSGTTPYPAPGIAAGFRAVNDSVLRVAVPAGVIEGSIKVRYNYQGAASGSTKTRPFVGYSPILSYTGGGPVGGSVLVQFDSWAGNGTPISRATGITLNGVVQNVTRPSPTVLQFTVLPGAETGRIRVEYGTSGYVETALDFLVTPAISSFAPAVGIIGNTISLTGSNFRHITAVRFDGTDAVFTVVSPTQLTAIVPPGARSGRLTVLAQTANAAQLGISATDFTVVNALTATWSGAVSSDWMLAANWVGSQRPGAQDAAIIPGGATRYPVITAAQNISVGELLLAGGAILTLNGTLTLTDDFTAFGELRHLGGTVILAGAMRQTLGGTPQTYRELVVGPIGASLIAPAKITRLLTLQGDLLAAQYLTLASTAASTAMVVNAGGVVLGDVFVQRYVAPGTASGLGYRHLSAPVQTAQVRQLAVAGTNGFAPIVNQAFNTLPFVAPPTAQYPNVFGFDETRGGPTADFSTGYFSPNLPTDVLTPGRGYSVYMRPLTPTFFGSLQQTDLSIGPLTRTGNNGKSGWHLLGNPFPSPLDWDAVAIPAGLSAAISVWQSTGGANGVYRTRVSNGDGTGTGNLTDGLVPMGQGFFAQVLAQAPPHLHLHLTLTNDHRLTAYANPTAVRPAPSTVPTVQLTLQAVGTAADTVRDDTFITFRPNASVGVDAAFDGPRPALNTGHPTLVSATATSELLAVNALPTASLQRGTTVELTVGVSTAGHWALALATADFLDDTSLTLLDRLTQTRYDLRQLPTYTFTAAQAGAIAGRFALVIGARPLGAAALTAEGTRLEVAPNPAHEVLQLSGAKGPVDLLDVLGRVVLTTTADVAGRARLEVRALQTGVYVVRNGTRTRRVVVE